MTLLPADPRPARPEQAWPDSPGDLFRLTGAVGPEAANSRDDIIRAQILLGHAGDLDLEALGGPTGWPGGELTRGLRRYQRRKGLTVDGLMLPDGETIRALQNDLFSRLGPYRAPTTAEVDEHHDRMARYRPDERDALPPTALRRPGEGAPAYVQREDMAISDVDAGEPPAFAPGTQLAQALPVINPAMTAPAAGAAGQSPPDIAKAGDTLKKFVGDRINLLTLPVQIQSALTDGAQIRVPSMLLDPAIEQASKTPPSMPSAPKEPPPEGSKPEEREPTLEELIPPEMKPWAEGLEPFDQQLARELMLVYNRRGGPETIKGNAIIVKEMMEALKKYPALADGIEHAGGSHSPDIESGQPGDTSEDTYKKELYFRNAETDGRKGSSWADVSFRIKEALSKQLGIEYWHLSSAEIRSDTGQPIDNEIEKGTRLGKNSRKSRVDYVEKPKPIRINGEKAPYDWESYQVRVRNLAERLAEELDTMRTQGKP